MKNRGKRENAEHLLKGDIKGKRILDQVIRAAVEELDQISRMESIALRPGILAKAGVARLEVEPRE